MIRTLISVAALMLMVLATSCNKEKNKEIFEDFEGEEGVYMIKLPPAIFLGMLDSEIASDNDELGNIDFVKVMFFDETKASEKHTGDILSEITGKFDSYGYEMAIQFSSSGNNISAYLLENEEFVSDLMIVINGDESLIGLGLSGRLDGKALMQFASEVDYNDLSSLVDIGNFSF